jgi:hypothetical protein
MKFRSTNPGRGAPYPDGEGPMGIEECFQSGAVPKRGKVGKVCGIHYQSDNSDGGILVGIEECPFQ